MLKNYPGGIFLEGMDEKLALVLINNHPDAEEKKGCGIRAIMIVDDGRKGKHFEIHRKDGSKIDFSYRRCLEGPRKQIDKFRAACRTAVMHDVLKFRDEMLKNSPICRHRGISLTRDNADVDHVKPHTFNVLVANFISKNHLNIDEIEIIGDLQRKFKDMAISCKFREYHRQNAILELVSKKANQKECKELFRRIPAAGEGD